ncbi:MAG: Wzz/FepE/Etk N-terminal domain-containing protein [Crocinitomicaceae bacterium]|jgi:LPS O-antigen subunit length determinant protein (WzzB/FepE family)|nr:Wzz/FepE/Etk N-terminal domain-containing protein [Crocinitomicaceae bacterium]
MTDLNLQEERFGLIQFIWKNKKPIFIMTGIAAVVSIVVSFLITPMYLSSAIVFPAASGNVSFDAQRNVKAAAMDFGEEEQAEQLVQILQSSRIKDRIVKKYHLMADYEIAENDPNKYYKLNKAYYGNFSFNRTRFGSIQIDVLDKDPKKAANMANNIVDLIDTVKNEMIRERTIPAFEINLRKKKQMEHERDSLLTRLEDLAKQGVLPNDVRATLYQALVDSKSPVEKTEIQRKIDINTKFGSVYDGLEYQRNEKIVKIEDFRVSYEQAESDANAQFNHKFVVEKAVVADRKEKPKRMIIVLVSTIGGFIFGLFFLLIQQRIKELKLNEA